jgi:hypothetical protein
MPWAILWRWRRGLWRRASWCARPFPRRVPLAASSQDFFYDVVLSGRRNRRDWDHFFTAARASGWIIQIDFGDEVGPISFSPSSPRCRAPLRGRPQGRPLRAPTLMPASQAYFAGTRALAAVRAPYSVAPPFAELAVHFLLRALIPMAFTLIPMVFTANR